MDASGQPGEKPLISGEYDFNSLVARIKYAINQVNAVRVSMDCLSAIFTYLPDKAEIRNDLFMIASVLGQIESTVVVTSERSQEYGDISTHGVEEFVADNVIILRNAIAQEKRRRTIEILKYRGSSHQQGEFPFSILSDKGVVMIPLSTTETLTQWLDSRELQHCIPPQSRRQLSAAPPLQKLISLQRLMSLYYCAMLRCMGKFAEE